MSITGLSEAFSFGAKILDKLFPDPVQKQQVQIDLLKLEQAGELAQLDTERQIALAQAATNTEEAKSPSLLVSGARPAMMWCCVAIFAANYIGAPLLAWLSPLIGIPPPPRLDIGEVLPVLFGMLGLGVYRTAEKMKGVAS